jgi:hypothetical protein
MMVQLAGPPGSGEIHGPENLTDGSAGYCYE